MAQISAKLGIHVGNFYNWRKTWRLQCDVVPDSEKDPEGWCATGKFTVVLDSAGLNATWLSAYCRERGLYPEKVELWKQAGIPGCQRKASAPLVDAVRRARRAVDQKELERLRAQVQGEFKRLKQDLRGRKRIWRRRQRC